MDLKPGKWYGSSVARQTTIWNAPFIMIPTVVFASVPAMILLTDSGMDFISNEKQLRAKLDKALK